MSLRAQAPPGRPADVVLGDPPVRAGAAQRRQLDAELLGEAAHERRRLHAGSAVGRHSAPPQRPGRRAPAAAGAGAAAGAVADHDEHRPDRDDLAFSDEDPRHPAGRGRGDLDRRLVRLDLDERVVLGDLLPLLHEPAGDLALGQALAQVGQLELVGHRRRAYRGDPTQASAGTISTRSPPSTRQSDTACSSPRSSGATAARHVAHLSVRAAFQIPIAFGSCAFSGSGTSASRAPGLEGRVGERLRPVRDAGCGDDANARVLPAHELAGGGVAQPVAALAALEPEPKPLAHRKASSRSTAWTPSATFTTCVTRRSTTTEASASASPRVEPVLAAHQVEHPVDRDPRGAAECSSKPNVEPGAVDPGDRPLELEVVADVERQLRLDRAPRSRYPRPRRHPAPRGRRRPRRARRRPGSAGRASFRRRAPCSRCSRRSGAAESSSGCPARRRHPEHAQEGRQPDRAARRRARRRPRAPSRSGCGGSPNVTPHDPGTTSSIRTASVCPARAPRTSIGPASGWPVSSSGSRRATGCVAVELPPGVRDREPDRVARLDRERRLELAREVAVQHGRVQRQLVPHR